jgi:hypothetical protein
LRGAINGTKENISQNIYCKSWLYKGPIKIPLQFLGWKTAQAYLRTPFKNRCRDSGNALSEKRVGLIK